MREENFSDWLFSALARALSDPRSGGKPVDPRAMSPAEIVRRLDLPVNRETLRRILREDYLPTSEVQLRLRQRLAELESPQSMLIPAGLETQEILLEWYRGSSGGDAIVEKDPFYPACVISRNVFSDERICFICIDDDRTGVVAPDRYFLPFILEADERFKRGEISAATLVTRRKLPPKVRDERNRAADEGAQKRTYPLSIYTLSELIARRMNVEQAKLKVNVQLNRDDVDKAEDILPIEFSSELEGYRKSGDAMKELISISRSGAANTVAILGSFGTGKSVLLWRAASLLLAEHKQTNGLAPLPVIVDAKSLRNGATETLINQVSIVLRDWYSYSPPGLVIENLLKIGQLALFVDAVDESKDLRRPRQIRMFLQQLADLTRADAGAETSRALVVVTSRREVFDSHAQENVVIKGAGFARMILHRLSKKDSNEWLEKKLKRRTPTLYSTLRQQAKLFAGIEELIRTPLFLRIVDKVVSDTMFDRGGTLESQLHDRQQSKDIFLSEIYSQFTEIWFSREQAKAFGGGRPTPKGIRRRFCQQLAVLVRGPEFRSEPIEGPLIRTLVREHYISVERIASEFVNPELDELEFDAKNSSFLVRDEEHDRFRFSHDSFADFFQALAIKDALEVEWPKEPDPNTESSIGMSQQWAEWEGDVKRALKMLAVLFQEPLSKGKDLVHHFLHSLLSKAHPRAEHYPRNYIEGKLSMHQKELGRYLSENQLAIWHFNLLYLRVAMDVCEKRDCPIVLFPNAYLASADFSKLPSCDVDAKEIPSVGFHLRIEHGNVEFARLNSRQSKQDPFKSQNVLGPWMRGSDDDPGRLEAEWMRGKLESEVKRVADFCVGANLVKRTGEAKSTEARGQVTALFKDGFDFQWCVIPGGTYKQWITRVKSSPPKLSDEGQTEYQKYMNGTFFAGANPELEPPPLFEITRTVGPVALNSFLIQRHPVTNGQYLAFLTEKANARWRRSFEGGSRDHVQREDSGVRGNLYYLAGWDGVLETEGLRKRLYSKLDFEGVLQEIDSLFPSWSTSPVVYVGHQHAKAFARFYGLDLPTRAQYEAAARLYQADPFWVRGATSTEVLADTPWTENGWDGYAFAKKPGTSSEAFPFFDCTVLARRVNLINQTHSADLRDTTTTSINLSKFAAWAAGQPLPGNIPLHLLGCVSEWLRDIYDVNSALGLYADEDRKFPFEGTDRQEPIARNPCNDGLYLELIDDVAKVRRRGPHPALQRYAVREGSFRQPGDQYCKISRVADMPGNTLNPDIGFRCVKVLHPA